MTSAESAAENDIQINIQDTLALINEDTIKINNELNIINQILMEKGSLHLAVLKGNEKLQTVAKEMGFNVENILSQNEDVALPFNRSIEHYRKEIESILKD